MRLSANMMLGQQSKGQQHNNYPKTGYPQAAWTTTTNNIHSHGQHNAHLAQNHTSGLTGLQTRLPRAGGSNAGVHQAPTRLPAPGDVGHHSASTYATNKLSHSSSQVNPASPQKVSYSRHTTSVPTQRYVPTEVNHKYEKPTLALSKDSTVPGSYSSCPSDNEDADGYLVSTEYLPDPLPEVCPKSKKMALGSITFSADQGKRLGVPVKDNSFFLRVEKCDEAFCDELNFQIERMHGFRAPPGVEDQTEFWPEGALYNYCQKPNQMLQREMDRVYRHWHDTRCGMSELYQRLLHVRNRGCF